MLQISKKIFKYFVLILVCGLLFMTLLAGFFLPTYFLLPSQARSLVYHTSKSIASVFMNFSDLQLDHGVTCNQSGTICIRSFILQGEFILGDEQIFSKRLHALKTRHPDTKTVCLNSPGGRTSVAGAIAKEIKDLGLNTCVGDLSIADEMQNVQSPRFTAQCESACAMLMLAGYRRMAVGDRFVFGIHSPQTIIEATETRNDEPSQEIRSSKKTQGWGSYMTPLAHEDMLNSYKNSLAISDEQLRNILKYISHTPFSKRYYPSTEELFKLGFINESVTISDVGLKVTNAFIQISD